MVDIKLYAFHQAALYEECRTIFEETLESLTSDGKAVPLEQREWKIGKTFSWHYVKNALFRIEQLTTQLELLSMPKPKGKNRGTFDASAYVFVKCELRSEDKASAKIWIEENTADIGPMLHDVMASGYKFSCSFSPDFDTFTACLVGKEDNPINGKKTLTARHKDWVSAAMTVLFKHHVFFKAGVWEAEDASDDDGWA